MYLLGTLLSFHEKGDGLKNLHAAHTRSRARDASTRGAERDSLKIESCKVINIADRSKRKNLFHSLVNNSSDESFSRLELGKTSSHVENFKSQFRHRTINYSFK